MDSDEITDVMLRRWWGRAIFSAIFCGIAWLFYSVFSGIEAGGPGVRVRWYIAVVYYIGGKWVLVVPFAIVGFLFAYLAVHQLITGKE